MFGTAIRRFTVVMFKNSSNNIYDLINLKKIKIIFRQARGININIKLLFVEGKPLQS